MESAEQRSTQVAAYQAEITREREALELTDAPATIDRERVPGWWPG